MGLPTANLGPNRQPTHQPLDHAKLMKLGVDLEDVSEDGAISFEAIDEYATSQGVSYGALYCAAVMTTELGFKTEHDIKITVCGGKCQSWGAAQCIDELVDLKIDREDDDLRSFDILSKGCLDKCDRAVAISIETPWGNTMLEMVKPEALRAQVEELLSAE